MEQQLASENEQHLRAMAVLIDTAMKRGAFGWEEIPALSQAKYAGDTLVTILDNIEQEQVALTSFREQEIAQLRNENEALKAELNARPVRIANMDDAPMIQTIPQVDEPPKGTKLGSRTRK